MSGLAGYHVYMHSAAVESYLLICDAIEQEKLLVVPGNLTRVKQRGATAGYMIVRPYEGFLFVRCSNLRGESRMGCSREHNPNL